MNKETTIAIVALILIGIGIGISSTIWYYKPKIAEFKAEQIRMDAFADCLESKIIGIDQYAELMLLDVLNCLELVL